MSKLQKFYSYFLHHGEEVSHFETETWCMSTYRVNNRFANFGFNLISHGEWVEEKLVNAFIITQENRIVKVE